MGSVSSIVKQLKKERDRVEHQLSGLNAALSAFAKVYIGTTKPTRKKRTMSAAGRKRLAAAQRARWVRVKRAKKKAA
jgi:phosphopantetheine adenylyltransferase